jgi:hypothetical protein
MDPYLVIVILNPTKKQRDEDGTVPTIVVQPTAVMAKDEAQAAMKAFRLVPEEHSSKDDRLDVRVLPFRPVAEWRALRPDWAVLAKR